MLREFNQFGDRASLASGGAQALAEKVERSGLWWCVGDRARRADQLRNVYEEREGHALDAIRHVHGKTLPATTAAVCCGARQPQDNTGKIGIKVQRSIVNGQLRMLSFCAYRHAGVRVAHNPKGLVCNSLVTTEAAYRALKQPLRYGNRSHQPSFPASARREGAEWPAFLPATARLASAGRALFRGRSAWASS